MITEEIDSEQLIDFRRNLNETRIEPSFYIVTMCFFVYSTTIAVFNYFTNKFSMMFFTIRLVFNRIDIEVILDILFRS